MATQAQPQQQVALELQQQAQIEGHETSGSVLAEQAKALVQARYIIALQRPRDWDVVRQRILKACDRPTFAETAVYKKPIGGSYVSGLSIRFAEEARRDMCNIQADRTIIYDDLTKRIVRISLTDLEANNPDYKDIVLEKTVERRNPKGRNVLSQRLNSSGEVTYTVEATEDELLTKESALSSKIERQLTLKILPGDIQDEALRAIRDTQKKADKSDPDAAKKRLIDAFDDLGIRVADLKSFLGIDSLDGMQPNDVQQLRDIYTAIKEGETNWREVMEQRNQARGTKSEEQPPANRTSAVKDAIKNRKQANGSAQAQATASAQEVHEAQSKQEAQPEAPAQEPEDGPASSELW